MNLLVVYSLIACITFLITMSNMLKEFRFGIYSNFDDFFIAFMGAFLSGLFCPLTIPLYTAYKVKLYFLNIAYRK